MIRLGKRLLLIILCLLIGPRRLVAPAIYSDESSRILAAAERGDSLETLIEDYRGPLGGLERDLFDDAAD
jgi:hypothetical protein